jgi:hypothetical protein
MTVMPARLIECRFPSMYDLLILRLVLLMWSFAGVLSAKGLPNERAANCGGISGSVLAFEEWRTVKC